MKPILLLCLLMGMAGNACAQSPQVCAASACVRVEIVKTDADMNRGLSGRAELPENDGMLFAFEREGRYSFWMPQMNFPLDILWLDKNGRVIFMKEGLAPCGRDQCPQYASDTLARYVLEVNAGYAKGHGIKPGDTLSLPRID